MTLYSRLAGADCEAASGVLDRHAAAAIIELALPH
jgi:hypothetical protein